MNNWELIVKESQKMLDKKFSDGEKEYIFYGIVHCSDDFYYGMVDNDGRCRLLSCVGSIESAGFNMIK